MGARNRLFSAIPTEVRERLEQHTEIIELPEGRILHRPGEPIHDVYFPLDCLISVTITMLDGRTAEAGVVGSREMVGVNAFMSGRSTNQTEYVIQVAGVAIRMPAEPLLEEFDRTKSLRDLMLRYTQAYIAQLSQNVACNRYHGVNQRLARWLLEARDRLESEDMALTQEFIGQMLGNARPVVSAAAAHLQDLGLIRYGRKAIQIIDSKGLEAVSCECFAVVRDEYDRLL